MLLEGPHQCRYTHLAKDIIKLFLDTEQDQRNPADTLPLLDQRQDIPDNHTQLNHIQANHTQDINNIPLTHSRRDQDIKRKVI